MIGDSHAHPDVPNDRFDWLRRLVDERRPSVLIDIGDSADMPSLFGCDTGSRRAEFEGQRYKRDVEVYVDSRERLGKAKHKPRLEKTLGNHEFRISRIAIDQPKLAGWITPGDLRDADFGWHVSPFLVPIKIDGVAYCHYFKSPGTGDRPVGGVMQTRGVIQKYPGSFSRVFGHTHRFEWFEQTSGDRKKITSVNAGCYFEPKSIAHQWAGEDIYAWRSGILELEVYRGQILSHTWFSYEHLKENYA